MTKKTSECKKEVDWEQVSKKVHRKETAYYVEGELEQREVSVCLSWSNEREQRGRMMYYGHVKWTEEPDK